MQIPQSESELRRGGPLVRPGEHVRVRGVRWRIVDVRAHDACRIVTLSGLSPPFLGLERRVIEPFDVLHPIAAPRGPRVVGAERWRGACRGAIAADTPPGSLAAARNARIDLMAHQLAPAMAVAAGVGTRVLLADEVGLGKTVEAGLVVAELRARGWIERVLVLAPAGLREQWREELHGRFDLDALSVDAPALRRLAATLPIGANPWTTIPAAIASIDYVKRAEVLPAVASCRWDVVVIDEAHGAVGDSDRHDAARILAARAPYVLLLTATPHSGDSGTFAALRDLGSAGGDRLLVFRRTRAEVRIQAQRRIHTLAVRPTHAERRMHAALARYGAAVRADGGGWLALSVLHKRAFSSGWALLASVERRLIALAGAPAADAEQIALPLGDPSGDELSADEAPDWPIGLALSDPIRERRLLEAVASACRAIGPGESKIGALVRLLRRAGERTIVFTEYRDTLLHVRRRLARLPVVVLHGGLSRDERAAALLAFAQQPRTILLATDAAGEGLNLHAGCRLVVNLELPWNPMRLEQRIGRVDRIGQNRTVHAVHLVARDTGEIRILDRLRARVARAQSAIGAPDPLGLDEIDVARLVITGDWDADPNRRASGESQTADDEIRDADFNAAAAAETDRLRRARAVTNGRDEPLIAALEGDGPWIMAASGRRRLRAALGAHAVLIWRITLENASRHVLAARLVPLLVDGVPRVTTHAAMKRLVRAVCLRLAPDVDAWSRPWRDAAASSIRALVSARLDRERAIAQADSARIAAFQPGLFDRRAERSYAAHMETVGDARRDAADRIAALARAADISCTTSRLLLAVLP